MWLRHFRFIDYACGALAACLDRIRGLRRELLCLPQLPVARQRRCLCEEHSDGDRIRRAAQVKRTIPPGVTDDGIREVQFAMRIGGTAAHVFTVGLASTGYSSNWKSNLASTAPEGSRENS